MTNEELCQRFEQLPDVNRVRVTGDGYHFEIELVSDVFEAKSKVARQQWVYSHLRDVIASGELHAISIKTYTHSEWERQHGNG